MVALYATLFVLAPVLATPTSSPQQTTAPQQAAAPQQTTPPADPEMTLHAVEEGIIAHTNAQRARFGLRPLIVDRMLLRSARRHGAWMARNRAMQHTTAPVAENIAMGQNSPAEAMNSWMNSPGHRANILNASYSRMGAAAYTGPDGRIYWCQQFQR